VARGGIVTIYSVEQDGDIRFLTMERVEGQSLDQVIPRGGMPLGQVLEIGATLADALAASHEKGIIHRDLKPANIMLAGRERRVKVLDFGLAKLREEAAADGETTTAALSGEGRVLGTVAYMSPEQAEGKPVDARSDLFSLGIVLYEMATGERPFTGETSISVLSAILRDTPKSVTDLRADLPKEFARIIRQCLQKDPEERYQTAKDVRNQLRALKVDLDSGDIVALDASVRAAPAPRRRRLVRWLTIGAVALTFVAITAVVAQRVGMFSRVPHSRPFESIRVTQITDTGTVGVAAVSPDGRYVVYSASGGGQESLRLRLVATGSDVQIVAPAEVGYNDVTFSPDANFVYFVMSGASENLRLYRISALGGTAERLLDDANRVRVSPDGARIAFVRNDDVQASVLTAAADGTDERRLVSRKEPERLGDVAWSPDGQSIAFLVIRSNSGAQQPVRMLVVDARAGGERDLGMAPVWIAPFNSLTWLRDGRGFLVVGGEPNARDSQLWIVPYPLGEARRITHDVTRYYSPTMTSDERTILATQRSLNASLWVMSANGHDLKPVRSSTRGRDGVAGLDWTADNRLIFASEPTGAWDLWTVETDGTHLQQLTSDPADDGNPVVSPDGSFVVFNSARSGRYGIWRIDIDGRNARPITARGTPVEGSPSFFTRNGTAVAYSDDREMREVPVNGGESVPLIQSPAGSAGGGPTQAPPGFVATAVSPDGRWLAGWYSPKSPSGTTQHAAIVSIDGTRPWRDLPAIVSAIASRPSWTPDGRSLAYVRSDEGVANIWAEPLDGGTARKLTSFTTPGRIYRFALSDDGRTLAVSRGEATTDLVMITSEEKK